MIGTKVRALAERGAVRDLIDVHAASQQRPTADLEMLGRRHARFECSLHELRDRLTGAVRGRWTGRATSIPGFLPARTRTTLDSVRAEHRKDRPPQRGIAAFVQRRRAESYACRSMEVPAR
ncbi:hypothetical protein GCM10010277_78070 [Streptomyces longisporoflavus]|nr:hypothetical protein GCM10010277_78070 [Streptomyces longisporoflavus]